MIAFLDEEETACGCGHPRDEAWDEDNEQRYRGAAYDCFACAARDRKKHEDEKASGDAPMYGRRWIAVDRMQEG